MNGSDNFAGIFGPMTAGFIIRERGNWALPFLIAAFFAVISVLVFCFLVVPEPLAVKEPVPQTVLQKVGV
jgi:MFS family permease